MKRQNEASEPSRKHASGGIGSDLASLTEGNEVALRTFIDKYIVEVFVNNRQAVVTAYMDYRDKRKLATYSFGSATTIERLDIWKIRPINKGYFEARESRIWGTNGMRRAGA